MKIRRDLSDEYRGLLMQKLDEEEENYGKTEEKKGFSAKQHDYR